jgi:hypothetical protein
LLGLAISPGCTDRPTSQPEFAVAKHWYFYCFNAAT